MKKIIYLIPVLLATLFLNACNNEDATQLDYHDPTVFFMPSDSATDSISVMRRQFFSDYGSYLLFNDTLQNNYLGKDVNGENRYFTETIDVAYSVGQTAYSSTQYNYTYFRDYDDCKAAVNFMKKFILIHLSNKLKPFSWFLAKSITGKTNTGNIIKPYAMGGQRCIVLSCGLLPSLKTDALKQSLADRHLVVIIGNLANNNSSAFEYFYNISGSYYGSEIGISDAAEQAEKLHSLGFISADPTLPGYYPSRSTDLSTFASIAITYTDDKVMSIYGKYPLIIEKVKIMKDVLTKLGYIL